MGEYRDTQPLKNEKRRGNHHGGGLAQNEFCAQKGGLLFTMGYACNLQASRAGIFTLLCNGRVTKDFYT